MSLTEEFITNFQSLPGETVGKKQKHLRELIKTLSDDEISNLDFSQLSPKTRLEEKLKIDALIYLKRTQDLLNALRSENPATIKRIFKLGAWFYVAAFANVTEEELVNNLFPYVSYNVKIKLVNKLAIHLHNADQADSIFNAIKTKYGLNLALRLLPACNLEVLLPYIEAGEKLPPSQMLSIIKKHPEHLTIFLEAIAKCNMARQYNHILNYVMKNHTDLYIQLHIKHGLNQKLGKRLTAKFIVKNTENVINNPNTSYQILHNSQIPLVLRGEFPQLFANLYPSQVEEYANSRRGIIAKLQTIPSKINALELYLSTFQKVYGCEIWDHPPYVSIHLLKLLKPDDRESRLISAYKNQITEEEWMSLHKTEISIPFFLKKISLTSDIDTRRELIKLLVDTCKFNDDLIGLRRVCDYMLSKHRNDNISVRVAFLRQITKQFLVENLEETHWTCINDMLQIFTMNQESYYEEDALLEGYIHYRLKNNLPIDEQLQNWVSNKNTFNLISKNANFEKLCLTTIGQIISEGSYVDKYLNFLSALVSWNKRHKSDKISLFLYPQFIEHFKKEVHGRKWMPSAVFIALWLLKNSDLPQKLEYFDLFILLDNRYEGFKHIDSYIKNHPLLVISRLEKITRLILSMDNKFTNIFMERCQYLHHLNIPQQVIKVCLEVSQEKSKNYLHRYKVAEAIFGLTYLMPITEFNDFVSPYQPNPTELNADTDKNKFTIQKLICKNVRYLRSLPESLPIVLNFCKGDYLKFIRASLYSICGYTAEDKLKTILYDLSNRAAYKHALHVAFRNTDRIYVNDCINHLKQYNKISIRRLVFKVVFNIFVKDPNEHYWDLLKSCVNALDVKDKESFDMFFQIQKIPRNYLIAYQIFTWNILLNFPSTCLTLANKRSLLLDSVDAEGSQALPTDFIETIIKNWLFKSDYDGVYMFACKYVIHCKDTHKQEERLKFIFSLLKNYIDNRWSNPLSRGESCLNCSKFIKNFCSSFLEKNNLDKRILQVFYDMWVNLMQPHESFADYLYLRLTLIYPSLDSTEKFLKQFGDLCSDLTQTYGIVIVEFIHTVFDQIYSNYLNRNGDDSRYTFIEELLNSQQSEVCTLIAILLMGDNEPCNSDLEKRHNVLIETLKKKESMAVRLFLNRHIRGETTLEYHHY